MKHAKITVQHLQRKAYIYVRQSTMGQVLHHQESTQRQYALQEKALAFGWRPDQIRIFDGDLGQSGAHSVNRDDFKTILADVSLGEVGAVLALEASRLARSNTDWHRLIELGSLAGALIVDEDGVYDPTDFNDSLLLGLKGTMSAAELHFLRGRLQGGKLHKAERGELRIRLPVGYCWDEGGRVVLDPDREVQNAVRLMFRWFRETGSAYGVVHRFSKEGLKFPQRVHGGVNDGKRIWGHLTNGRVVHLLKNPAYAGVYVFGRFRGVQKLLQDGAVRQRMRTMPRDSWLAQTPRTGHQVVSDDGGFCAGGGLRPVLAGSGEPDGLAMGVRCPRRIDAAGVGGSPTMAHAASARPIRSGRGSASLRERGAGEPSCGGFAGTNLEPGFAACGRSTPGNGADRTDANARFYR